MRSTNTPYRCGAQPYEHPPGTDQTDRAAAWGKSGPSAHLPFDLQGIIHWRSVFETFVKSLKAERV
eukprot:9477269-Pyramimonas_sp.AAC.1